MRKGALTLFDFVLGHYKSMFKVNEAFERDWLYNEEGGPTVLNGFGVKTLMVSNWL